MGTGGVHELALMECLVETVLDHTAGSQVRVIHLEIGELAGVDVAALRFSFGVCVEGTPLAGSELDIVRIPGRARCRTCGHEERAASLAAACRCGSFDRALTSGDELRLANVEVTDV
ncbi:MAG TPA: hydrogenase maturation nickel metallochaperone HypA [Kofleriaceae bacterium]|nr:hydrogenase maturation nickel metallochaperone HypA [Kofleriaceae bacterium]